MFMDVDSHHKTLNIFIFDSYLRYIFNFFQTQKFWNSRVDRKTNQTFRRGPCSTPEIINTIKTFWVYWWKKNVIEVGLYYIKFVEISGRNLYSIIQIFN